MPAIRHACPVEGCATTLSRHADVKRHLAAIHIKERRWSCPICSTSMTEKSNMKIHIENVHFSTSGPTSTRRSPKPRKARSTLAPSVEPDHVDFTPAIESCPGALPVTESHPTGDAPCKVDEQAHTSGCEGTPTGSHSVPPLSPSSSVSDSTPAAPWEYVLCEFGSDLPIAPLPSPSSSVDYYTAISQSDHIPCSNFDSMPLELFSGPSFDINVACADLLPTIPVQEDAYTQQCWNPSSTPFIPAYGLGNALSDSRHELWNVAAFDLGLHSTDPSVPFLANEPGYGAHVLEGCLEYQPAVVDGAPVYPNSDDFFLYDDVSVPSVNPTGFSDVDFSYFDPSWSVSASPDSLDASNYL